jgi:hypothetical protein
MIYVVECVSVCLCYTEGKSKRTFALTVRRGKNETTLIFEVAKREYVLLGQAYTLQVKILAPAFDCK